MVKVTRLKMAESEPGVQGPFLCLGAQHRTPKPSPRALPRAQPSPAGFQQDSCCLGSCPTKHEALLLSSEPPRPHLSRTGRPGPPTEGSSAPACSQPWLGQRPR